MQHAGHAMLAGRFGRTCESARAGDGRDAAPATCDVIVRQSAGSAAMQRNLAAECYTRAMETNVPRIDAHVHYLPPAARATLAADEPYWALLLGDRAGRPAPQGYADAARLLADMDAAGIDQVVIQGIYPQQQATAQAHNDAILQAMALSPGRLIGFAAAQPLAGAAAVDDVRRCVAAGMRGVGELNPYAQGFTLDDPRWLRFVEACGRADLPICLHVNATVGPAYPGKSTLAPEACYELARRFPEIRFLLAHWGGGLFMHEIVPAVRQALRNVWYDTAASPLLYPTAAICAVARASGVLHKLVYASDYPLRLYPRTQREPDFRPFLADLDAQPWDAAEQAALFGGTMAAMLRAPITVPPIAAPMSAVGALGVIDEHTAVHLVATASAEAEMLLERLGIVWQRRDAPAWQQLGQAAAARGLDAAARARLIATLRTIVAQSHEGS